MYTCKKCGEEYPDVSFSCPKCGDTSTPLWKTILVIVLLWVIGIPLIGFICNLAAM